MPEKGTSVEDRGNVARPGSTDQLSASTVVASASVAHGSAVASDVATTGQTGSSSRGAALPERPTLVDVAPPTHMGIDSVATLPHTPQTPAGTTGSPPIPGRTDVGMAPPTGMISPAFGGGTATPASPGGPVRATVTGRTPVLPGQGTPAVNPGHVPGGNGIFGGRPVPAPSGRPMGAIPRGTVVGGESTTARGPMGTTAGTGPARPAAGRQGQVPGRALPPANGGVGGGSPQQPTRAGVRPLAPGSSGAVGNSGAVTRGGISGGTPSGGARPGESRSSSASRTTQPTSSPRTGNRSGQSRHLVEDEETWQQGVRRTVPPVID